MGLLLLLHAPSLCFLIYVTHTRPPATEFLRRAMWAENLHWMTYRIVASGEGEVASLFQESCLCWTM